MQGRIVDLGNEQDTRVKTIYNFIKKTGFRNQCLSLRDSNPIYFSVKKCTQLLNRSSFVFYIYYLTINRPLFVLSGDILVLDI